MRVMKWSMIALAVAAGTSQYAMASAQDDSKGFLEDSKLDLKTRAMYMNRDFKNGAGNTRNFNGTNGSGDNNPINGYREDTGISTLLNYESGFTQGTVGVGVDAMAMGSARIDGGAGRAGNGLFANNKDGEPADTQSKAGAAVKLRLSNSVLKYGNQVVASPVFTTDDGRLLPEVATGTLLTVDEIPGLNLIGGRFTAMSAQTGMGRDSINGRSKVTLRQNPGLSSANIIGGTYTGVENLTLGLHASDVEDYWKKQYINVNYTLPITDDQALNFDLNGYRTKDQGKKLGDDVDNKVWSLATAYSIGAHKFTLSHQRSSGDTGYAYGVDGGGTVYVNNSMQISDFVAKDEKSWRLSYNLNMASYGVPGLTFGTSYVKGYDVDTGDVDARKGKENEWDTEAKYVIQEGPAKDLSMRVRYAHYRSTSAYSENNYQDLNDLRVIIEYPLSIL